MIMIIMDYTRDSIIIRADKTLQARSRYLFFSYHFYKDWRIAFLHIFKCPINNTGYKK